MQIFRLSTEEHFKCIAQTIYMYFCQFLSYKDTQRTNGSRYFDIIEYEDPGDSNPGYFIKWIEETLKLAQREVKRESQEYWV